LSGSNLSHLRILEVHNPVSQSHVREILDGIQDYSKLESLHLRDEDLDIFPTKFIERAPLKHLRLWPKKNPLRCRPHQYTKLGLRPDILKKSTLEHLVLGLNRNWYTPEVVDVGKYLPALCRLWLDLSTFMPELRVNPTCANTSTNSWTCCPGPQECRLQKDELACVPQNMGPCSRQSPATFLDGLDAPNLRILKMQFPCSTNGSMFLSIMSAVATSCRLQNLSELVLSATGWMCRDCSAGHPRHHVPPEDLGRGLKMLLPLPQLRRLKISVAPNFLFNRDMDHYRELAEGLPALEVLCLGHREWSGTRRAAPGVEEGTLLSNIATFCSLLPKIQWLLLATLAIRSVESPPRDWVDPGVKVVFVYQMIPEATLWDYRNRLIHAWFPRAVVTDSIAPESRYSFHSWCT
jgi:hypothetical protein